MIKYRSIIIVGQPRSGKSTWAKERIKKLKLKKLIYDTENEYSEMGGIMMPFEQFLDIASNMRDHLIFIEEATIYLSNRGDEKQIRFLLVTRRHRNNILMFTFHSLQQIPLNILGSVDLLVMFHTGDNYSLVEKKFGKDGKIFNAFKLLKRMPHEHAKLLVPLR